MNAAHANASNSGWTIRHQRQEFSPPPALSTTQSATASPQKNAPTMSVIADTIRFDRNKV
jgi:hypothetical protein